MALLRTAAVNPFWASLPFLLFFCFVRYALVPRDGRRVLIFAIVLIASTIAWPLKYQILSGISFLRPLKYDLYIFAVDKSFGFQLSSGAGLLLAKHRWLHGICTLAYNGLPLVMILLFAHFLWARTERQALNLYKTFMVNLMAAVPIYVLIPVCGPAYAFKSFPDITAVPSIPHTLALSDPPNGIPSVHFSTALLIAWYTRSFAYARWFGGAFLFLTGLATLGLGEHYLLDLLIAVPYTIAVYRATNRQQILIALTKGNREMAVTA